MVTCQTVLIHLKDPRNALVEMLRVLKPGGLLLVVEPSNFANCSAFNSVTDSLSIDEVMNLLKFELIIEKGKRALGLGFNSEGDLIVGYLTPLGVEQVQVFLSDKASPLFAPYLGVEQQLNTQQMKEWADREFLGWDREEMKRYFLVGGGDLNQFDFYWEQALKSAKYTRKAIDSGSFHTSGGNMCYLISARKKLHS